MSFFKKPKRNIRKRDIGSNDENDEENDFNVKEDGDSAEPKKSLTVKSLELKPKKEKKKQSILSFEEEWNEADDGEVFQVKKSSQSKKIRKLLDKERKKKKDGKSESSDAANSSQNKSSEITIGDEITIKIKNNLPILNGREAEAAECDGISSEEEEDQTQHKFSHPDHMKMLLKSGRIPDAAMIHAARKRRQQAREMGDYIPIEDATNRYEVAKSKSRLIREDDNDASDDDDEDGCITMTVNTAEADREKRREAFHAAQDLESEDIERGEDEEWEKQQIRKGVTGAQLAAAQQENLYYAYTMPPEMTMAPVAMEAVPVECVPAAVGGEIFPPLPSVMGASKVDPHSVAKRLQDRLTELKEVHRRHVLDRDERNDELNSLRSECVYLKEEAPKLAERFRFYQDLRGYVTDLVECLDEKVVILVALEQRLLNLYQKRATELISRRRQDIKDQAEELAPTSKGGAVKRDEAQIRRAAEREGRRIRRMKARESRVMSKHIDGMSSDDEVTEMEASTFRAQKDQIEQDSLHVFEDALDEFSTVRGILQRFESWKQIDKDAYREAYVNLCLPKVLGPLIRLQILMWSPFIKGGIELERTNWNHSMLLFGLKPSETEETLRTDPDVQLVPLAVEKILLPKLDQLVCAQWDPMSSSQTLCLVSLVTKLLQDYPTLGPNSKVLTLLINNIVNKMKDAVDNDVYIPIYPKHMLEGRMGVFFQRQFASAVKLLSNLVRWQGVLSDTVLCEVALDSLLNRYLLSAVRICDTVEAATKCQMIGSVLPRVWLHPGTMPKELLPLINQAKMIAQQIDPTKAFARDVLEKLSGVLKAVP